jgi:hypothetical protein
LDIDYYCHFQEGKGNESLTEMNINVKHEFDKTDKDVDMIIYATSSIPILPAEVYGKFPNFGISVIYKQSNLQIQRNWFKSSQKLRKLIFSKNEIPLLNGGNFKDLENLEFLGWTQNTIGKLDNNAFAGLKNLKNIYFVENNMELILNSAIFEDLVSLEVLDIDMTKKLKIVSPQFLENQKNIKGLYCL